MGHLLDGLAGDVIFSLRRLRRALVYTATCTLTLGLGIGAAAAIFAIVDAMFIRPLPFARSDRLVGVGVLSSGPDGSDTPFGPSQMELIRWESATQAFESIEAAEPRILSLSGEGEPELVRAAAVSSGWFRDVSHGPGLGSHVFCR